MYDALLVYFLLCPVGAGDAFTLPELHNTKKKPTVFVFRKLYGVHVFSRDYIKGHKCIDYNAWDIDRIPWYSADMISMDALERKR